MRRKVGAGLLLLALLGSGATVNLPFGSWSRASDGPILSPQGLGWESAGTFNPAVLFHDGKFIMQVGKKGARVRGGTPRPINDPNSLDMESFGQAKHDDDAHGSQEIAMNFKGGGNAERKLIPLQEQ